MAASRRAKNAEHRAKDRDAQAIGLLAAAADERLAELAEYVTAIRADFVDGNDEFVRDGLTCIVIVADQVEEILNLMRDQAAQSPD